MATSGKKRTTVATGKRPVSGQGVWELRLYIAGHSARATDAISNLKRICDEHLAGQYRLEVIDLLENPPLARGDQILACRRR